MIRPIDIRLNAAHPELPLLEAVTFTGSPSTVLIRGVPPNCGRWAITAVFVAASFPDGSTTTRAAVQSANGVWVATLPATATSGRTANGLRVMADGIDENGDAVTGYILGVADFAVASLDVTPAPEPGETSYQMLYFDTAPSTLRKGDVAKIDGVLKFYNGTAWEPFATLDNTVTPSSANGVKSSGIWSAIWGALAALPTGFSSLYDWCVDQLAGKANRSDVDPLLFAQYYPDGSVKSAAEFTSGIKYDDPDTTNRTITVKPFCNTGDSDNDNSGLVRRVVIPPFVDAQGNPYISDDGTRYKVVGVSDGLSYDYNRNLTAIVAPNTVTTIGTRVFDHCTALASVSLPAATGIGNNAFSGCTALASVSLPAATGIGNGAFGGCRALASLSLLSVTNVGDYAFNGCISLASISLPAATTIGDYAFYSCSALSSVDFGDTPRLSVPSLGAGAFSGVPTVCKIIVPYTQYDEWIAADVWKDLPQEFVRHAEKADKPATFTTGNLAALDAQGNPTDSQIPAANVAVKGNIPYSLMLAVIRSGTVTLGDRSLYVVQIDETLSPNTLTINFPTATSGKVRDFAMRLNIAAGVTAPEIAWPQGVALENDGGEVPEIADGGTGGSSTILYFSETENDGTTAKFLVKGETLTAITQA